MSALIWVKRSSAVAYFFSQRLGTEVTIQNLDISSSQITLKNFHIANPTSSKTASALFCQTIEINAPTSSIFFKSKEVTIDSINLNGISIGVEIYKNGSNNWATILGHDRKPSKKSYFIKTLELHSINVSVTNVDGQTINYPQIDHLVFHNVKGLPVDQIEKAIMQAILKDIFQRFNLNNILDSILPGISNILKIPFMQHVNGGKNASF